MSDNIQKVMLIIVDGYGEGEDYPGNAVTRSNTPFIDQLRKNYPMTTLKCLGENVGLPKGSMGGSEVGHFTIGAGRVVFQSLEQINRSIRSEEFFQLPDLQKAAENCQKNNSKLHLLGMISDQGIHSHLDHLWALMKFAKKEKLEKVYIHAITDGRDVPEKSAKKYLQQIEEKIQEYGLGKIATIVGRYYAMDRDNNFDRTQKAFDLMTKGIGTEEKDPVQAIENEYEKGTETDYYINPIILDKDGLIEKDDSLVFFNFRSDRARQLSDALTGDSPESSFNKKEDSPYLVCFGPFSKTAPILFEPEIVKNNLGETISKAGLIQLRIAETEKYPHVTFFFNSQIKEPYPGQEQVMVASPKVPSYDQKPEMSTPEIAQKVLEKLANNIDYHFVAINFANPDLVGHSGNMEATVKAIESVDQALAKIIPAAIKDEYIICLTADHGNSDKMTYENGEPCPSHSFNPVFFIVIDELSGKKIELKSAENLGLKDVAPTILKLMGIEKPKEMTGESLIK